MANLRGIGGGLGRGVGEGLGRIGDTLTEMGMKDYESQLVAKRQIELSKQNQKEALLQKALTDPDFAHKLISSGLATKLGIDVPDQTSSDLQKPIMDLINKAKSPTDLPTNEQMAANDQQQGGQFDPSGGKGFTAGQIPISIDDILARTRARDSKQAQFGAQPKQVEYVNPEGVKTQEQTTVEGAQGMAEPLERDPLQEGERAKSVELNQATAREEALHTPSAISGAAQRAGAIAEAEEPFKKSTLDNQANRSATQYYVRALAASNSATKLEAAGATRGYTPITALQNNATKQYEKTINDFVATIVYLQSGKQINENEMETYKKAYFVGPYDDPATAAAARAARGRAMEGAKFIAQAGGGKAGLDAYIKSGGKVQDLINPSDPLFQNGGQGGIKMLDDQGNPVGGK